MISVKELKDCIDNGRTVLWKGKAYVPTQYMYGWTGKKLTKMVLVHPKKNKLENYWIKLEELTSE